MKTMALDR
jgi:hypothetical protein